MGVHTVSIAKCEDDSFVSISHALASQAHALYQFHH